MTVSRTGTTPTPFGFVGGAQYQTDADSGLMLLGHRYYDASIGRFISSDPIQAGTNWYAYCTNNPLRGIDPTGLINQADALKKFMGTIKFLGWLAGAISGHPAETGNVPTFPSMGATPSPDIKIKPRPIPSEGEGSAGGPPDENPRWPVPPEENPLEPPYEGPFKPRPPAGSPKRGGPLLGGGRSSGSGGGLGAIGTIYSGVDEGIDLIGEAIKWAKATKRAIRATNPDYIGAGPINHE